LYFDEPDTLLGKRTDVRDSRDRYANAETAYFLQRPESYQGLAILATKRKGALDAAFTRLLGFVIDFLEAPYVDRVEVDQPPVRPRPNGRPSGAVKAGSSPSRNMLRSGVLSGIYS
jgi:hypothetical protein